MGTDPINDSGDKISLDGDIDLQMTQIMSEARKASDAIRQTTQAIRQNSGATSVVEPATAQQLPEADSEPPTAGFVLELERLANGLQDIADSESVRKLSSAEPSPEEGSDAVKKALRDLWTQHAALADTVSRMHEAVAEADASIGAFKEAMNRLEEAAGTQVVTSELHLPEIVMNTDEPDPVTSETDPEAPHPDVDPSLSPDASSRRAALQALRSLSG